MHPGAARNLLRPRRWVSSTSIAVFGANTDVGKTLCSIGLCRAAREASYLKPVQTGVGDASTVERYAGAGTRCEALYSWEKAVSPHVAATNPPSIAELTEKMRRWVERPGVVIVESAGGVLSPTPCGSAGQADAYAVLPWDAVLLVGDPKLGGISTTLCAAESLEKRGLVVTGIAVVGGDPELGNAEYLSGNRVVVEVPGPPPVPEPLDAWVDHTAPAFEELLRLLVIK